jgi:predicted transcriptional regulator of viral defense system
MNIQKIILLLIENAGWDIFTVKFLKSELDISSKQIYDALSKLEKNGIIIKLEKGKYCRHNFSDEYVIGSFIVKNGGIAYWTALNFHGLTEQIPNVVYVQTTHAKRNKSIFGVRYKFIRVKEQKLLGFKTYGYGNHRFQVTDIEKTIVDCFDLPQYGGGYNEIIKGFYNAKLSAQKMVKYCKAINNIAVTKRLAYLCELLEKPKMDYFIKYAKSVRNEKYNLFESDGDKNGKADNRWHLILNMGEDEIIEIAHS